jgi:hypothetical protein
MLRRYTGQRKIICNQQTRLIGGIFPDTRAELNQAICQGWKVFVKVAGGFVKVKMHLAGKV